MKTEQSHYAAKSEFNWVKVRAECTIQSVFKQLRREIDLDVAWRNEQLSGSSKNGVSLVLEDKDDHSFVVYRRGPGLAGSISFGIFGSFLKVIDSVGITIDATVGMNDYGRCVLRMDGSEMETWQFRKRTLEDLFFWL
jgi:hypothetical protein